tara:strand:- start:71 stop:958 length:888 start_codon:yes stop_codon:yes gene_type:complete
MPKIIHQSKYKRFQQIQCCKHQKLHQFGWYKRKSDSQKIDRFRCHSCGKTMSNASLDIAKWQKKRQLNHMVKMMLASNMSMRRIAKVLHIDPKTVARKLVFLGTHLNNELKKQCVSHVSDIQFDELQTIEHTKCKPLSVVMAVCKDTRQIVGFQVSKMPATGHLAKMSRKKYGIRPDERQQGLHQLFAELQRKNFSPKRLTSDECTLYKPAVKQFFPNVAYAQFKGAKSSIAGQGELKKQYMDPLFSINHTFAMLRANINRLIRKTWCTTKRIDRLVHHIAIYAHFHNNALLKSV